FSCTPRRLRQSSKKRPRRRNDEPPSDAIGADLFVENTINTFVSLPILAAHGQVSASHRMMRIFGFLGLGFYHSLNGASYEGNFDNCSDRLTPHRRAAVINSHSPKPR